MATLFQPQPPKQTNYLPWVIGGCAVAFVLGIIVVGVAGVLFYAMTPGNRNGGGGHGPGSGPRSKDDIEREISRKRQEAMMGFQNVYSPTTGEHWEASYSDYNATGPGYYHRAGNSYEKLNEGFPPN